MLLKLEKCMKLQKIENRIGITALQEIRCKGHGEVKKMPIHCIVLLKIRQGIYELGFFLNRSTSKGNDLLWAYQWMHMYDPLTMEMTIINYNPPLKMHGETV